MNTDLRIPVTTGQKQLIMEAISDEPAGLAAWAREVLIQAARERISDKKNKKGSRARAGGQGVEA